MLQQAGDLAASCEGRWKHPRVYVNVYFWGRKTAPMAPEKAAYAAYQKSKYRAEQAEWREFADGQTAFGYK